MLHHIRHRSLHRSREAIIAIRRYKGEHQCGVVFLNGIIHLVLPTTWAAVQTMSKVVAGQLVLLAVDAELAVLDAVGVASDTGSEVAGRVYRISVLADIVEAQNHVCQLCVPVGYHQRHHASAEIGDAHFHTIFVFQGEEADGLFVNYCVEGSRIQS